MTIIATVSGVDAASYSSSPDHTGKNSWPLTASIPPSPCDYKLLLTLRYRSDPKHLYWVDIQKIYTTTTYYSDFASECLLDGKDSVAIAIRSLKDRFVTIVSLTLVLI